MKFDITTIKTKVSEFYATNTKPKVALTIFALFIIAGVISAL